jgi:hypothetical protein
MKTTNGPNVRKIVRENKKVLYKALSSLRDEGIRRLWGPAYCKQQARDAVKKRKINGGWAFHVDLEGVKRANDIAIQFAGSNGILQERMVANRILEALTSAGLRVEWQGRLKKKILVDVGFPAQTVSQPVQKNESNALKAVARWLQSIARGGELNAKKHLFHSKVLR